MFTLMKQKSGLNQTKNSSWLRFTQSMTMAIMTMNIMLLPVFAATLDDMFNNIVGLVCKVFFYIGAVLLVWAIGQLVLAFKNEDADSKSRAVMVLVCAVMLLSISTIYTAVTNGFAGAPKPNNISF